MEEIQLVADLVLVLAAALVGGWVAHRLGQPVILGYLVAGILISPYSPGPAANLHNVQILAEVGVALLMFAVGVEFSLSRIVSVGRAGLLTGLLQLVFTTAIAGAVAMLAHVPFTQAVVVGSITALSSTAVVLRLLSDRGELHALHGRLALAVLILQDLAVIPAFVILPSLAQPPERLATSLGLALAQALVLLILTYVLGTRLVPKLLFRVAATASRELFLLTVLALALGTALATSAAGLSIALGAFLAGILVSESEFSHHVLGEVLPLRDLFSTIFFVSIGMVVDPRFVAANLVLVLAVTFGIVVGKAMIGALVPVLLGLPGRAALLLGFAICQIGEFSFVLARVGGERAVLDDQLSNLLITSALLTMLVSPLLIQASAPLADRALRLPGIGRLFAEPAPSGEADGSLASHVVICGHGRVGSELAQALERRGFRYVVVEYNPHIVRELQKRGVPAVYGDAGNPAVLAHVNLPRARVLALTIPDPIAAERAVRIARRVNARLDIIGRASAPNETAALGAAGATEIVQPEFEAALEFVRHVMHRYGVPSQEIAAIVAGRRQAVEG